MSGRLRFEVWTVPTAATFSRLADNLPVLPGGVGTVVMSDYGDATIAVPLDATELPLVAAGALITVLDGTTIVDEFFAEAVSKEVDRQGTPYASISGPGINGGMAKIAVYPFGLPNDIDWIWGSDNNLLRNPGADENPLGIIDPGFENGTLTNWHAGAVDGISATASVVTTAPRTGTFHALVNAILNEGGMTVGVRVYPGKAYTFGIWGRTASGTVTWQTGASGPQGIVPGIAGFLTEVDASPGGWEAQANKIFTTTYAQHLNAFTAAADQRSSAFSIRLFDGAAGLPSELYVDDITLTGFGVGVDPWEFSSGVTAFEASTAVTPVDGTHHFLVTADPGHGVFQGIGNFLPGETVTLSIPLRGASAHRWAIELRDVRGTIIAQSSAVLGTGAFSALTLTTTMPDFIPGPDGEIQVWVVNYHSASSTAYFDAAMFIRGFAAATATEILRLLMEAAYARGTALWLDISSFSDTLDSDGVALSLCPAFQTGPPQNMAHVARNLAELENGIEWTIVRKATPSGTFTHDLKVYIKGGLGSVITDGSKAVIGTHAGTSLGRLRGFTAAGALGNEGLWAEDTDTAGVTAVGRWERAFDVPHLGSAAALADFLDDAFADDEVNRTALQVQVRGDAQSVPLLDYRPGDTLPWIVPPHTTASRRVVTISWLHDDLAMYDVTGSKVFPGESATNKAIEILWDEVFARRSTRAKTAITRPESPLLGGGHPWWILATLGSSTEDRAIADVICDGVADDADILDGLLTHRNVWLCDSGEFPYIIDDVMALGTDIGDLMLAGEPGSMLALNYNGPFFSYFGGGSGSIGKILWIYGVSFDAGNQPNGTAWGGGGLNAQPYVFFDHCLFHQFDTFVVGYERLMQWAIDQCLFTACTPAAFIGVGGFVTSTCYITNSIFDSSCSGDLCNNPATIFVAHNQLASVAEVHDPTVIYVHNMHSGTHSVGDHTGATGVDHGGLGGLGDDDHSQYFLTNGTRKATLVDVDGITGATSDSRYVGATASVAPTTGTFAIGDYVIARTGSIWICITAGTPGTWQQVGGAATDPNAIHDNVAAEISAIAEKTTLADDDWFVIEDSAASDAKKKVKAANLPGNAASLDVLKRLIIAPYSLVDAADVMWDSDFGDFTEQDPTGTTTWTERDGSMSVKFSGQATADLGALLKAHTFSVGHAFCTRMRVNGPGTNHNMVGLAFTDGTAATSNVVAGIAYNGDGTAKVSSWHGTLTNLATNVVVHDAWQTQPFNDGVYVKLIYTASNEFDIQWSVDGTSWSAFTTAAFAKTMTPTHFGLVVSRWNGASDGLGNFGPICKLA